MKEFASQFYSSREWQECRKSYAKTKRGLCEICLSKGKIVPYEIVHHKKPITISNVNNPEVTLNFSNLQCVCRNCHADIHKKNNRYRFDEYGRCVIKSSCQDTPLSHDSQ